MTYEQVLKLLDDEIEIALVQRDSDATALNGDWEWRDGYLNGLCQFRKTMEFVKVRQDRKTKP